MTTGYQSATGNPYIPAGYGQPGNSPGWSIPKPPTPPPFWQTLAGYAANWRPTPQPIQTTGPFWQQQASAAAGGGWQPTYPAAPVGGGAPVAPAAPSLPQGLTWSKFNYKPANAPSWWQAMRPSISTPTSEWLASMNMMIPFLSPEDQKTVAATLFQQDPKNFNYLKGIGADMPSVTAPTIQDRDYYTSAERAKNAIDALGKLASAMGKGTNALGPGFQYLRTILTNMQTFGGGNSMLDQQTRMNQMQQMAALDPLLGQSSGTSGVLSPYGPLAKSLISPFFSGGQINPMMKATSGPYAGTYTWGIPNAQGM